MAGSTNFPGSFDSMGSVVDNVDDVAPDHVNDLRRTIEAIEAKVGATDSGVDTSFDYKVNYFFVENTRTIWLYETTSPTGWTLQDYGDKVLAVGKTGTEYDSQVGGTNTDDWTISGITKDDHSHTAGGYYAASHFHTHSHPTGGDGQLGNGVIYGEGARDNAVNTGNASPSITGTSGTKVSGPCTGADGWRPSAYIGIVVQYTGS